MDELNRFFQLFLDSLDAVDESYYRTVYENVRELEYALGTRGTFEKNDFIKSAERIFCYEFYHQLKIKLDFEKNDNPSFLGRAILQAEVKKMQVVELLKKLGLRKLKKEYIPDLILHEPGTGRFQLFIAEIKCMPEVKKAEIWTDIQKLNEFIINFDYEQGVFLSVNASYELVERYVNFLSRKIERLEGSNRIKVICKPSQYAEPYIWALNDEGRFSRIELNNG